MSDKKPGYKTTEFWLTLLTMGVPYLIDALPPVAKAAVMAASGAVYTIARTIAKR